MSLTTTFFAELLKQKGRSVGQDLTFSGPPRTSDNRTISPSPNPPPPQANPIQQKVGLSQDLASSIGFLRKRFSYDKNVVSESDAMIVNSLQADDVSAYVKELVLLCVISTRTAWIIRRCTKLSDRVRLYLDLLTTLKLSDMKNLIKNCPKNRKFLEKCLGNASLLPQNVSENYWCSTGKLAKHCGKSGRLSTVMKLPTC